jgi:DNA invertase Pin-like site-specific DNA recombinase
MPTKSRKTAGPGRLIGYARVSTEKQGTDRSATNCVRLVMA